LNNNAKKESLVQNLLRNGIPFSIKGRSNMPVEVPFKIKKNEYVNLLQPIQIAYQLCLDGKSNKAAQLLNQVAGLLVATEIGLGSEFLFELEVRKSMPKLLKQIQGDLKKSASNS